MERLRIVSMNIEGGGIDKKGDDSKLQAAIRFLGKAAADVVLVQEAKWSGENASRLERTAKLLGMMGNIAIANGTGQTGCHLATFHQPDTLDLTSFTQRGAPFWHARSSAKFAPKEQPGVEFRVLNRHGPPFDPVQRLQEAHYDVGLADYPNTVIGGDFNCIPPGDPELVWDGWRDWQPPKLREIEYQALKDGTTGEFILDENDMLQADRRPAIVMERNGLLDVGAQFNDRRPTAGSDGSKSGPRRLDRFHATRSLFEREAIVGYGLLGDPDEASQFTDHSPIYVDIDPRKL